jgi:hypothetical protein
VFEPWRGQRGGKAHDSCTSSAIPARSESRQDLFYLAAYQFDGSVWNLDRTSSLNTDETAKSNRTSLADFSKLADPWNGKGDWNYKRAVRAATRRHTLHKQPIACDWLTMQRQLDRVTSLPASCARANTACTCTHTHARRTTHRTTAFHNARSPPRACCRQPTTPVTGTQGLGPPGMMYVLSTSTA